MSHRYSYGPFAKHSKEGVRDHGRESLTNACVVGILRGDKKKRNGLRDEW